MADPTPDPTPDSETESAVEPARMAEEALASAEAAAATIQSESLELPAFDAASGRTTASGIGMLSDVDLNVKIELGRTRMLVEDLLRLDAESVIELDKAAGDPVDIFVNDRHVARGEVLVVNENFCVRVSEILSATGEPGVVGDLPTEAVVAGPPDTTVTEGGAETETEPAPAEPPSA